MPGVSFTGSTIIEISLPNLEKLAFEKFRPGLAFRTTNWCDCAYTEVVSINYLWHFKTGVMPLQSVALKFSNVAIMHKRKNWCGSFNKQYKTTIGLYLIETVAANSCSL